MTEATTETPMNPPVVVHKALLSLKTDESVYEFMDALREAVRQAVGQKLNLTDKDYMYPVEIFSDKVVVSVSWGPSATGAYKPMSYYSYSYARDNAGKFSFSDKQEVKRVTRYEPVAKNADGVALTTKEMEDVHKSAWQKVAPFWAGTV